ncbi:dioxygenase family protein [Alkalihalobacterium elongatum]|uniref:dioxygenase family protein n=1 Tax=Alkalihalobacterium elongatum TaxID=2675466 RepID=UPI001C1F33FC|nr:class III extradiol ring-cleavage dioxygenase [Alkalihalobacterium elongatum]
MLPSLFVAHGAPLLAIENNEYTKFLKELGDALPRPTAIVLFSAHWESNVQMVGNVNTYSTIYDFGGFSEEIYRIQYPAKGNAELAKDIQELFEKQGISFQVDTNRGLDHGAWVVLRLLYPNADVPVISMSVNPKLSPEEQYQVGKALASLREKDVLIIASGGTVHNLRAVNFGKDNGEADEWALRFDQWLEDNLKKWDLKSLFDYETVAPGAELAVPTYGNEHFIPIFYAMGAADSQQTASLLHRSYRYGNLSHSVWQFG